MGTDAADLRGGAEPRRRDQRAAQARRRSEASRPRRSTSQQQSALDRAATERQRKVLEAAVPKGQQPTASQLQAAMQAAREFYATGKIPPPDTEEGAAAQRSQRAPRRGEQLRSRRNQSAGRDQGRPDRAASRRAAGLRRRRPARCSTAARRSISRGAGDATTPLLIAMINGQFDVAMLLVERGANPNLAADGNGVTPLWAAINTQWQPRTRFPQPQEMELQKATYLDVMKALLEARRRSERPHQVASLVHGLHRLRQRQLRPRRHVRLHGVLARGLRHRRRRDEAARQVRRRSEHPDDGAARCRCGAAVGGGAGRAGARAAPTCAPTAARRHPGAIHRAPPIPPGGPGAFALHAAAGVEYGEGFAGNAHRHAPEGWLPAVKYLVEELGADVNARDNDGYTPLHHAAARGDNEMIYTSCRRAPT